MKEKLIEKRKIFKGRILDVYTDTVELSNGNVAFREYITHNGGACVIAIDDDNYIYLVKQFRYPYNEIVLEVPAGKVELGEDPAKCASRELKEEVGLYSNNIELIHTMYPTPAYCNEKIYIYKATDITVDIQSLDEDEFLEIEKIHLDEAIKLVKENKINDAKTIIAIMHLALEN